MTVVIKSGINKDDTYRVKTLSYLYRKNCKGVNTFTILTNIGSIEIDGIEDSSTNAQIIVDQLCSIIDRGLEEGTPKDKILRDVSGIIEFVGNNSTFS